MGIAPLVFFDIYSVMALRLMCIYLCISFFCSVNAQQEDDMAVLTVRSQRGDTIEPIYNGYPLRPVDLSGISSEDPIATKQEWSREDIKNTAAIDVSDLLQHSSGVYVKSYGAGGLATVSLRGVGAGRSSTVWNGMPLIGSTLGLLDYSLLNVNLFESVRLSLDGKILDGSGSAGGGVYLNNRATLKEGEYAIGLKTVLGSFDRFHQGANYSVKSGKWWSSTRVSLETSKNDFTYQIREDLPIITNTNAARKQLAIMQSIGYKINDNNEVDIHLWAQENRRDIPPTTVQTRSAASVSDKTIRLQGIWGHQSSKRLDLNTIVATSFNQNKYEDPINGVFGDNIFKQVYLKSEARYNTDKGNWLAGISNRLTQAETNNYNEAIRQNQLALFVNYFRTIQDWHLTIALREDLINENLAPISGEISMERAFQKHFLLNLKVNRHFRAPALNDLYWAPGGNANLVSERGWGQELSLHYDGIPHSRVGVNVYNNTIQNWIQWGLLDGGDFFQAMNLPKVWSRGLEGFFNTALVKGDNQFDLQVSYNYNPSTYQFSLLNPDIAAYDQVYYTPLHQTVANLSWTTPQFKITYAHRYQSGVTTIIDPLEGFHLGELRAQYIHRDANFFIEIDNLWNANYRVIERRAMPGRNFNLGVNFEIKESHKNLKTK